MIDAAQVDKFALLGISQGCAVSIAYAVRHPERVTRLVLYGGFARGRRKRGSHQDIERSENAIETLMRQGWGQENRPSAKCSPRFSSLAAPPNRCNGSMTCSGTQRRRKMRCGCAARWTRSTSSTFSRRSTCQLSCSIAATMRCNRSMKDASWQPQFPGARFVALEGHNHLVLESIGPGSSTAPRNQGFLEG